MHEIRERLLTTDTATSCEGCPSGAYFAKEHSNVKKKMGLSYIVLNKRSESVEEKFDIITARAGTSIKKFLDINYNLFKKDSIIILLKGKTWREEIKESKKKWKFQLILFSKNRANEIFIS